MKIGEIAKAAGVSRDTVRHYIELGLLEADKDMANGYQMFNEKALNRLKFIKTSKNLGLQLADVQLIFADAGHSLSPCPRVRDLMIQRLRDTRAHIAELNRLCERMSSAIAQWEQMPDGAPNGESVCQLIESQFDKQSITHPVASAE